MVSESVADKMARERARNFESRFDGARLDAYKGIPIFAAPGLHELAMECLLAVRPDAPATQVLELGAGGGAMSQRLADHGYGVQSSDLFADNFSPKATIPFVPLDLNEAFGDALPAKFDVVIALELIEHLENPHHFFRQCRRLLAPGGHLLVSTPNLANPVSQAMFLRQGVFQWFREEDYRDQGHIMPLAPVVLRRCWTEAGLHCVWEGSVSDPLRMLHRRRKRGMRLLARLLAAWSGTPRALQGEVYLALLQPPGPV